VSHPQRHVSERQVLHSIMDWLAAKHIYAVRMNSGSMVGETNGKRWRIGLHEAGTADILAFDRDGDLFIPTWIEVKRPNGKQSELQKSFQDKVVSEGHRYILAYSIDDLQKAGL
jgi:hypothetical protein